MVKKWGHGCGARTPYSVRLNHESSV